MMNLSIDLSKFKGISKNQPRPQNISNGIQLT
jgi:hypothetical protein